MNITAELRAIGERIDEGSAIRLYEDRARLLNALEGVLDEVHEMQMTALSSGIYEVRRDMSAAADSLTKAITDALEGK